MSIKKKKNPKAITFMMKVLRAPEPNRLDSQYIHVGRDSFSITYIANVW